MPTREIDATALETLLAAAVAAPSIHNTQPWRFGMDPATRSIEVRADRRRALPLADPEQRARHLSVGAALFNLRVAVAHLGWESVVRLLPDPAHADLLATVQLTRAAGDPPDYQWLYPAIERRHTSRMPFTGRPVPEPVVAEMVAAAQAEGARLHVPGIAGTRRLLRLTAAVEARNQASPARTAETRTWITAPAASTPYGIPFTALGPQDTAGRMPMRDFTGPLPVLRLPALRFERHAQLALLWTAHDRPENWLRAGQGLERVLLTATEYGLRTSMLHQAMEWPDLRDAARLRQRRCCPQLLIRFGYGPEGGRTPRATARPDSS
ncbi:Acg family FMN-binding oxidoreductase [Streptomyces regalis]|uniref:Aromatic ring-opening dioxygenase LigA n=1 Tax=Streptomyces regalis TaxID=68262 RepID=A0A124G7R2_9ACTN|nr:aromatic ring-opening dioxygenase LigA [Streptomyces regalis]KUL23650.1 aromatic ring-opening dioxygenase LigA [Streptomyces regalis]